MKLEDILSEWDSDSEIDRTKIDSYSLETAKLHSKYIRILSNERLLLKKYEAEYKELKFDKYEFFDEGPSEKSIERGWELPPRGRIIKSDIQRYLDADKDIIALSLKIGLQQEKIEALKSIVDVISRLGFQIKNAIDYMRFMSGN